MNKTYNQQLEQLFEFHKQNAPPELFFENAQSLKRELSANLFELKRLMDVLDSLVRLYAPNRGWDAGFITEQQFASPPAQVIKPQGIESTVSFGNPTITMPPTKEYIRRIIPNFIKPDDTIDAYSVVEQLKKEGDTREKPDIAKQVGNVLHQDGWIRIEKGKYVMNKAESKTTKIPNDF